MSYTKGPWALNRYGEVISSNGEMIQVEGFALSGISRPETRANRDLLSAAPEMIEALEGLVEAFESMMGKDQAAKGSLYVAAANAIAKARGQQ